MPVFRKTLIRKSLPALGLVALIAIACGLPADELGFRDILAPRGSSVLGEKAEEWSASVVPTADPGVVTFRISVKLPPGSYLYSTTQREGAPTKIQVASVVGVQPNSDAFVPDHPPKSVDDRDLEMTVEKFFDNVTWSRSYKVASGTDLDNIVIAGTVDYQICDARNCRIARHKFEARAAAVPKEVPPSATTQFEHVAKVGGQQTVGGKWSVTVTPRQVVAGAEVTLTVRADLGKSWHVYPIDLPPSDEGGSLPTVIGLTELSGLIPQGTGFRGPAPLEVADKEGHLERYHEGRVEWSRKFKVPENATPGDLDLAGKVAWQMCNSTGFCLLATGFEFGGELTIAAEEIAEEVSLEITSKLDVPQASEAIDDLRLKGPLENVVDVAAPGRGPREASEGNTIGQSGGAVMVAGPAPKQGVRAQGLPFFLFAAVLAGFAALLTPCVFPMIPITVSFFQKQSEKEHHRPFTMALVYCLGIMGTFTGLGMLMSIVFGAGALNQLANNVWLNLFIGSVLVFFAFNLLGMFEIRVPSWLLTYTAGKESHGGYIGVLFMALTFTLTSFTCTFAFAGLLLAEAMKGDRLWPVLGLLAFSAAFSLPFFFLAIFPSMLQKLPKSGGWMNVIKVVMGMIELGAAFKYFGTADQSLFGQAAIFDFHLMVSAWVVISIGTALYLLGMFRLSHDIPSDHIGVVRFMSAMSFLGLAAYLGVGLYSPEKPQGAVWKYVEAYANPNFEGGSDRIGPYLEHGKLKYALDLERALDVAIAEDKPVFLDFTGVNCVNCRIMEKGPMAQPAIKERLGKFVRVQLFTDSVPGIEDRREAERLRAFNTKLQEDWYGDVTLPSYVVIPPDRSVLKDRMKILAALAGKNDEATFAEFLDHGLDGWKKIQARENRRVFGQLE
jgi:thiol:disulfide interchange protein DsbD